MKGVHGKADEENEWDHRISAGVKKDQQIPSGSMKLLQIKKMKTHKAPGLIAVSSRNDTNQRGY